jgi:hypothetical protein
MASHVPLEGGEEMKSKWFLALFGLALLVQLAAVFAFAVAKGHADPNLVNVPPHRHWINGAQVGPDICDNLGEVGIQHAFNEFHNNLHIATASSIGPAAPGLHNGISPDIKPTPCSVTTPPN